jgi:hypothetical protein
MRLKAFVVLLLAASALFAADVDGKWSGMVSTPNGDVPVAFTFKADGATLSGSTTGPDGMEVQIKNGKAEGNNIFFSVTLDFGGMPFTIDYKGVVSGADLKLKAEAMGMPFEFNVKKSK